MKFISNHYSKIIWLAAGLLIMFLFMRSCGGNDNADLKAELAVNKKEKQQARDSITLIRTEYEADKKEWAGRAELATVEKQESDAAVQRQQNRINQLTAIIRSSGVTPPPVEGILVGASYKAACDSLPNEIDKLNRDLATKDSAISDWSDILAYEVQIRDSMIEKEQKHSTRLNDLYNRQNIIVEDALARARPRGRLLGGFGILGNREQFVAGASGKVGYQDKRGKVYLISGHVMKFNPMPNPIIAGEISVLFKLF